VTEADLISSVFHKYDPERNNWIRRWDIQSTLEGMMIITTGNQHCTDLNIFVPPAEIASLLFEVNLQDASRVCTTSATGEF